MPYTEDQKAALSRRRGQASSYIKDPSARKAYNEEQGAVEAAHGGTAPDSEYERMSRNADDTIATQGLKQEAHARSQVNSADVKQKMGMSQKHEIMADLSHSLGGGSAAHSKKIKEIRTRRGHKGGYIHEHHHTHPEEHPMEEHVSPDQDAMVNHMMENMGGANPGEAQADAGQSGIPGMQQAAPAV